MKRLYICWYKDYEWIAAIVATSHKQAKKLFYGNWRGITGDDWCEWILIRMKLSPSTVDISKLPIGEIDTDWGLKHDIYTDEY